MWYLPCKFKQSSGCLFGPGIKITFRERSEQKIHILRLEVLSVKALNCWSIHGIQNGLSVTFWKWKFDFIDIFFIMHEKDILCFLQVVVYKQMYMDVTL